MIKIFKLIHSTTLNYVFGLDITFVTSNLEKQWEALDSIECQIKCFFFSAGINYFKDSVVSFHVKFSTKRSIQFEIAI